MNGLGFYTNKVRRLHRVLKHRLAEARYLAGDEYSMAGIITAVHVYGLPCDVAGIQTVADRQGLRIIYDAGHACGTRIDGRLVTDFGDASMPSLNATGLLHTADGSALLVHDPHPLICRWHTARHRGYCVCRSTVGLKTTMFSGHPTSFNGLSPG